MKSKFQVWTGVALLLLCTSCGDSIPENYGGVQSQLYLGESEKQPLMVGLGGSEGGNAWTSDRWKPKRDQFIEKGYAFLALGYFGMEGTPEELDRISIDAIHEAILKAAADPKIDSERIFLIGGSKGAELALLLASRYKDIKGVIALVPGLAAFPANTLSASTSSWTYKNEEVTYVPMPWAAVPSAMKHDLRSAFSIMLEDKVAVEKASIEVEKINGPILFVSATEDEMWPSKEMSDVMMVRLKSKNFSHPYEHLAIEGGHTSSVDHFDEIFDFMERNFNE